jgi:integrative and conjugative element protein (TIGR02256 family)
MASRPVASQFRSRDGRFGVRVLPDALAAMLADTRAAGSSETGGILVGRYVDSGHLAIVEMASRRTPDSRSGRSWLVRGVSGLTSWLSHLWSTSGVHYVGEWHCHPGASANPSPEDLSQMHKIARDHAYCCPEPILLIVGGHPDSGPMISGHIVTASGEVHALES